MNSTSLMSVLVRSQLAKKAIFQIYIKLDNGLALLSSFSYAKKFIFGNQAYFRASVPDTTTFALRSARIYKVLSIQRISFGHDKPKARLCPRWTRTSVALPSLTLRLLDGETFWTSQEAENSRGLPFPVSAALLKQFKNFFRCNALISISAPLIKGSFPNACNI